MSEANSSFNLNNFRFTLSEETGGDGSFHIQEGEAGNLCSTTADAFGGTGDENDEGNGYMYLYEQLLSTELGVSIKGQGGKLDSDADASQLLEQIQKCKNLKYLELEGNSLGTPVAKSIGKLLESHPEFEVALWKDMFTARLKDEIPKALAYLLGGVDLSGARLQRLDLSDNAIGPVGMAGLVPFFSTRSSFGLKELVVSNQGLGPEGGSTFASALVKCYESSLSHGEPFQLKVFICGRNRLENKAATKFAEFFTKIGSLEEIQMPQNGINPPGVRALASSFKANPNLRLLNLNDNTVRADGAADLSDAIASLNHLEELNLGDCLLKNEGVLSILKAIPERSPSLVYLNFESNELTKGDSIQMATILATFPNLQHVNLGVNEFGVQAAEEMNEIVYRQSNGQLILEFEDDTGSGNEEEEDQPEGDENWDNSNFKQEGEEEGDEDDEDYEDYDENPEGETEVLNISGGTPDTIKPASIFGGPPKVTNSSTSIFGGASQVANNNMFSFTSKPPFSFGTPTSGTGTAPTFGSPAATASASVSTTNSIFGGSPAVGSTTIFSGSPAAASQTSIFGGTEASKTTPLFGGPPQVTNSSTSLFGGASQSQAGNNNLFTFTSQPSSFSFGAPTFGIEGAPSFGSLTNTNSLVEEFIKAPNFANYMKLTPAAGSKILPYFEEKYKSDKDELTQRCISTAVDISNMVGAGIAGTMHQECFNELMTTALKSATNSNMFVTSVLVHLGLMHGENRPYAKVEFISDATTKALTVFLNQNTSPILVLQCVKEFFTPNTPAAKANIKIAGRDSLLEAVNRQLAPYYAIVSAK